MLEDEKKALQCAQIAKPYFSLWLMPRYNVNKSQLKEFTYVC